MPAEESTAPRCMKAGFATVLVVFAIALVAAPSGWGRPQLRQPRDGIAAFENTVTERPLSPVGDAAFSTAPDPTTFTNSTLVPRLEILPSPTTTTRRCPIPPMFVMTDKTTCPFVLNLCESMLRAGLPIAPSLEQSSLQANPCATLLRETSKTFANALKVDSNATLSTAVRKQLLDVGRHGCLFISLAATLPPNRNKAQYSTLLLSKARSWWSWFVAVKEHWGGGAGLLPPYITIVDADVQVFPGIVEALGRFAQIPSEPRLPDMVFQRDLDEKNPRNKNGNAGFFTLRTDHSGVERAMHWMAEESQRLLTDLDGAAIARQYPGGDQHLVYDIVRDAKRFHMTWGSFPRKLVNDGRAAVHWHTTVVHHPHMSGRYKPTNMRRLISAKMSTRNTSSPDITTGLCLPREVGEAGGCPDALSVCPAIPL